MRNAGNHEMGKDLKKGYDSFSPNGWRRRCMPRLPCREPGSHFAK